MRISMWILADWLRKYDPVVRIRQGSRVLQNARLFSDERKISRTTVYLDQIQRDRILCSSGHDFLVLHAEDVDEVFNEVLDAFEFYNNWTSDAYDLINGGCGLRELLEAGMRLLDRALILADATFYMRELCSPEALPSLRALEETRLLPLDTLLALTELEHIRVPGQPSYRLNPPGVRPGAAITNLFVGAVHKGWLVTVKQSGEYSQGDLDLQDAFCGVLTQWLEREEPGPERMDRSGVFLELLAGGTPPDARAEARLRTLGWYPADKKQLYLIRRTGPGPDPLAVMERYLERLSANAFPVRYEGELLYITDHRVTPPAELEPALCQTLVRCGCAAGKSPEFTDLSRLRDSYRTAQIPLRYGKPAAGQILSVEDAALPYIAAMLAEKSEALPLRHPALAALEVYDRTHEGQLKETLSAFLRRNCSYTETAAALFIHRSTLLYRLRRIQELTGLELEDYPTRLRLQLSFLMEDHSPPLPD